LAAEGIDASVFGINDTDTLNIQTIESAEQQLEDLGDSTDPDIKRTFREIVEVRGFLYEEHNVETTDGWTLRMFRVNDGAYVSSKKPVLIQHGLFSDADTWVIHKEESLAFVLAKAGYDTWLGNNRGNKYSTKNKHWDPVKTPEHYFDYSYFELGKYDAPAQIDFVLKSTGYNKLSYVGHSQGTS